MPITPFPTLFTAPVYRPGNNTVELTISNFYYENPNTGQHSPLEVWLGDIGPLHHHVYQPDPLGPLTNVSSFAQTGTHGPIGTDVHHAELHSSSGVMSNTQAPMPGPARYVSAGPLHTAVVVELPPIGDILKALQHEAGPSPTHSQPPHGEAHDAPSATEDVESSSKADITPMSIAGRSLPLLFIRGLDGIGYHSGRTIACESFFQGMDLHNPAGAANPTDGAWLAAAQAASAVDGGLHGWTLRVL